MGFFAIPRCPLDGCRGGWEATSRLPKQRERSRKLQIWLDGEHALRPVWRLLNSLHFPLFYSCFTVRIASLLRCSSSNFEARRGSGVTEGPG